MMIRLLRSAAAAAAMTLAAASASPAGAVVKTVAPVVPGAAQSCDEACLNGFIDQYLNALVAHDPAKLPAATNIRFTENTRPLKLGDGLWATISGLGAYRHDFADPKAGQAGAYTVIEENGTPALMTLRLKVVNHKITEAETILVRNQTMGNFLKTDATKVKPIWLEPLTPSQKRPRAEMIKAVDLYFDGLNKGDGNIVPFADDCTRTENGTQTVNNPPSTGGPAMFPSHPELRLSEMTCRDQFNTGLGKYIHEVDPRRFLIVDEDKGVVFGIFMFRHPGNITEVDVPGVGKVPMMKAALYPFDVEVAELFKVVDGKLHEIEAEMISLPYRSETGWDH